jgi:hypothetical protein
MICGRKDTESLVRNADVWAEIYASVHEKLVSYDEMSVEEAMCKITDGIHNRYEHIATSSLYAVRYVDATLFLFYFLHYLLSV